jgi:KAP family P-loop domain
MLSLGNFDAPSKTPSFDFERLAKALASVLKQDSPESAFVLGLHAPWGGGKTTLLRAIRRQLPDSAIIVEFNPWKFDQKEALWRALILCVLEKLREENAKYEQAGLKDRIVDNARIDEMEHSLYERFTVTEHGPLQVNWIAAASTAVQLAIGAATLGLGGGAVAGAAGWLHGLFGQKKQQDGKAEDSFKQIEHAASILQRKTVERAVQQVVSIEQFLKNFRDLVTALAGPRRIYVLIDDLDRCLPDAALSIFEAIKLFLDAPQCAYVVAVDRSVIRRGLELRYPVKTDSGSRAMPPVVDPDEYIEKTITLSADLPMLAETDGYALLATDDLIDRFSHEEADAIVFVLGTNPRRLKRFGAMLGVWFDVAKALVDEDKRVLAFSPLDPANRPLFIKLSLIGYLNSALLAEMRRDPGLASRLQQLCNGEFANGNPGDKSIARQAGELKPGALTRIVAALAAELPVIAQAALDPALWRALRLQPNLATMPDQVATALRWFRAAPHTGS